MVLEVLAGRATTVPFVDNMMQLTNVSLNPEPLPAAFSVQKTEVSQLHADTHCHVLRHASILCTKGKDRNNINTGEFHSCAELIKCYSFYFAKCIWVNHSKHIS